MVSKVFQTLQKILIYKKLYVQNSDALLAGVVAGSLQFEVHKNIKGRH